MDDTWREARPVVGEDVAALQDELTTLRAAMQADKQKYEDSVQKYQDTVAELKGQIKQLQSDKQNMKVSHSKRCL